MASTSNNEVCLYCEQPEDKQELPCFQCQYCKKLVHLTCLPGHPPSTLAGDVFFDFTCFFCSPNRTEEFLRSKMTWTYVLILSINNLQQHYQGISNRGFFHYKTHISWFIDRNWKILFGNDFKQKKNWIGTLVGALSSHSGTVFQSSAAVNGELGWWRLLHKLSPALIIHIIQEMARDKAKIVKTKKLKEDPEFRLRSIEQIATELGYGHFLHNDAHFITGDIETVPCKKRRVDSDDSIGVLTYQSSDYNIDSDSSYDFGDNRMATIFHQHSTTEDIDRQIRNSVPNTSLGPMQYPSPHYDSDSGSRSPTTDSNAPLIEESEFGRATNEKLQDNLDPADIQLNKTTLFSKELNSINNLPWLRPIEKPDKNITRLTEYEEIQLLKRVESMIPNVTKPADKAYLRRFRAKLALRRLKRNKHLPLFDLDNTVKYLGGYSTEDPSISGVSKERVLDRFQASYMSEIMMNSLPAIYLVGHTDYAPFQSPYSGAILKPFIRRDTESTPLWLSVMEELLQKTNRNNPNYEHPPRAPIDYSYVKPQHIAAVNNLCAQFFWPGVDLTETLQYPEFSCIVTYKKLVIGFAFLVPDAGHNTAYISFVLTRPEWRHSKIATFMLYHLLQTCTGQDVTLHVSPTNPAIFLYQQFGFKVEELIQDFYEKYFEINSKDCKHALFLRLTR